MTKAPEPSNQKGMQGALLSLAAVLGLLALVFTRTGELHDAWCKNIGFFCAPSTTTTTKVNSESITSPSNSAATETKDTQPTAQKIETTVCPFEILCPEREPYCSYINSDDMEYKKSVYEGRCRLLAKDKGYSFIEYIIIGEAPGCKIEKTFQGKITCPSPYSAP